MDEKQKLNTNFVRDIAFDANEVFVYHGSEWEHFNWENSGVLFGKVWDIEVASTGEV